MRFLFLYKIKITSHKMEDFDFHSKTNVVQTVVPSAKAINKNFCGKKNEAGIWIANENLLMVGWKTMCKKTCEKQCTKHFVNTKEHNIRKEDDTLIEGKGVVDPRFCVIRESPWLKMCAEKGIYKGLWTKSDNENFSSPLKKFVCAQRYLLLFVDEHNNPLHNIPIQLTTKGTFKVNFGIEYKKFKDEILKAYCKSKEEPVMSRCHQWYAFCVFQPVFYTRDVGKPPASGKACGIKNFQELSKENVNDYIAADNPVTFCTIKQMWADSEKWKQKYSNAPQKPIAEEKEINPDEDDVY